jgi:hypothetical protein
MDLQRRDDIAPIRILNNIFDYDLGVLLVATFFLFELMLPFSLIVLLFSSDKDATRNAAVVLVFGILRAILAGIVIYIILKPTAMY